MKNSNLILMCAVALGYLSSSNGQSKSVDWSTFSMGYDVSVSTKHTIKSMIGQGFVDTSEQSAHHISSGFLSDTLLQKLTFSASVSVKNSWNLLSIPVITPSFSKSYLFPKVGSSAFAYQGSYITRDSLRSGVGYWLRFYSDQSVNLLGETIQQDTLSVNARWNMIGSLSVPIAVGIIGSIPPGLVVSNFYWYDPSSGYRIADSLRPGSGYWVRATQPGALVLSSSTVMPSKSFVKIVPVTEQPPGPPEGDQRSDIPKEFALHQNYPNPFNPNTVISFELPIAARVYLTIYDVLGRQVKILIDEFQTAGYKSVEWDAVHISSGVYFYSLRAGKFIDSKKLLLLK